MLNSKKNLEPLSFALKYLGKCPLCDWQYKREDASLFEKSASASFLHLKCAQCSVNFVAGVFSLGAGISTVGALTDLNLNDIKRVYRAPVITLDEALTAHEVLFDKNFNLNIKTQEH